MILAITSSIGGTLESYSRSVSIYHYPNCGPAGSPAVGCGTVGGAVC